MDRGWWLTVHGVWLAVLLCGSIAADDSSRPGRIASPRRLFTEESLFPEPEPDPATEPAVSADSVTATDAQPDPLPPVPPADGPDFSTATPAPLPPAVQQTTPTPERPYIVEADDSNWLNRVVDEHLLIWRELPGSLEYIPGDGGDFGLTTIGFESVFTSEGSPGAWLVPKFGWHFLSGPRSPDLPPQLYTLAIEFNVAIDLNSDSRLHLHLAPTWATDFDANGSESFRFIAGGLFAHDLNREWMLALGAVFLDRPDLPALPLGGVRWRPVDHLELDLMFPRPRAAWRFQVSDSGDERWFYLGGGLGGDSWAFERVGGSTDRMGYLDLRFLVGVELRETEGDRHIFEAGYVFDRELDFDRGLGDADLPGTAVIRAGVIY